MNHSNHNYTNQGTQVTFMAVMMSWILSFATEDGQKPVSKCRAGSDPVLEKNPVILVLQITSGYVDYI